MKSLTFADSKFYCALQAADLASWVARAESRYRFFNEDYGLRELYAELTVPMLESKIDWRSSLWSAEHLRDFNANTVKALRIGS